MQSASIALHQERSVFVNTRQYIHLLGIPITCLYLLFYHPQKSSTIALLSGSVRIQREACPGDRLQGMMRTMTDWRSDSCIAHTAPQPRPKNKLRKPRLALERSVVQLVSASSTSGQHHCSTSCNTPPMGSSSSSCGCFDTSCACEIAPTGSVRTEYAKIHKAFNTKFCDILVR